MVKKLAVLLIFVLSSNIIISQNEKIKSFVEKTDSLDLDMWDLVDFAKNNLKSESELAQFFYYWIGTNISYDYELLNKHKDGQLTNDAFWKSQDYKKVYQTRKAVCAGYAELYWWFMNELEIEVMVISGHIRDERNHYVELTTDDEFRHAWNAVKLKNEWILLDSTWGASGDIEVSDYYFDIDPKLAIITHFPEDEKWQLLDKKISLEDFNKSKFIKPMWFQIGFTDFPVLKEDGEHYYLVYKSNPNKGWSINLFYSADNEKYKFIHDVSKIDQDNYTYVRFKKSDIPKKAFYKLDLKYLDMENGTSTFYFNVYYFKT